MHAIIATIIAYSACSVASHTIYIYSRYYSGTVRMHAYIYAMQSLATTAVHVGSNNYSLYVIHISGKRFSNSTRNPKVGLLFHATSTTLRVIFVPPLLKRLRLTIKSYKG